MYFPPLSQAAPLCRCRGESNSLTWENLEAGEQLGACHGGPKRERGIGTGNQEHPGSGGLERGRQMRGRTDSS